MAVSEDIAGKTIDYHTPIKPPLSVNSVVMKKIISSVATVVNNYFFVVFFVADFLVDFFVFFAPRRKPFLAGASANSFIA